MQPLVNKYIITNFIYGTGPFLRTTEIAIAVNKQVKNPYGIIVPWVMGEKQRKIMLEEFTDQADNIFLDKQLGDILNTVFYNEKGYEDSLRMWIENYEEKSREAQLYLKGTLSTETLSGKKVEINGKYIEIEINRSPRIKFGIEKSFGVTFGCTSEILKKVLDLPHDIVSIDRNLVRKAIPISEELEKNKLTFISYPGTFSYLNQEKNIETPPTITIPLVNQEKFERGVYVTVSGIPGLDDLYKKVGELGLKLYSNDPSKVPGSTKLSPHAIGNPNIVAQFARSGWGSVHLSQLQSVPLIVPDYDPKDDPEIYFNNKCIEELGLGIVYRGQNPEKLICAAEVLCPRVQMLNGSLLEKFGTLDGANYCAKLIVNSII